MSSEHKIEILRGSHRRAHVLIRAPLERAPNFVANRDPISSPKLKVSPTKMSSCVTIHERGRLRNSLSGCCPKALSALSARLWRKEGETEEKGLELSKLNIAGGESLLSEL